MTPVLPLEQPLRSSLDRVRLLSPLSFEDLLRALVGALDAHEHQLSQNALILSRYRLGVTAPW